MNFKKFILLKIRFNLTMMHIGKPIDTGELIGIMQNMGLIETNTKGEKL